MTTHADKDAALVAAFWAVGGVGAIAVGLAGLHFGARAACGVFVGGVAAVGNLWGLTWLVRAYLQSTGRAWAAVALVKLALIVGVVFELLHFRVVDILPVVVGYGAMPVGIVVARFWPAQQPLREER